MNTRIKGAESRKLIFQCVMMAIFIFLIGFGAMNIFWYFEKKKTALFGLYYYRAATWGDGLFLPLLVSSLFIYIRKADLLNKKDKMIGNAFSFCFGLLGIAVQASWLINDEITLNWTIPSPHHFNAAGWYHAVYFVFMFVLITNLFTQSLIVLVRNKRKEATLSDEICLFTICFSLTGYLCTHAVDDYSKYISNSSILLPVIAGIMFIIFNSIFYITTLTIKKRYILNILSAVVSAFSIVMVIEGTIHWTILWAIAGGCLSVSATQRDDKNYYRFFYNAFLIMFPIFMTLVAAVRTKDAYGQNIMIIITLTLLPTIVLLQRCDLSVKGIKRFRQTITAGFIFNLLNTVIIYVLLKKEYVYIQVIDELFSLIIGYVAYKVYSNIFTEIIKKEKEMNAEGMKNLSINLDKLQKEKNIGWFTIVVLAIGIFIYLISVLTMTWLPNDVDKLFAFSHTYTNAYLFIALLVILFLLLIYFPNIHKNKMKFIYPACYFMSYFMLGLVIYELKKPFVFYFDFTTIFAPFMIIASSFMIAESYYSNIYRIRNVEPCTFFKITTAMIFLGNMAVCSLCIFPSANREGQVSISIIPLFFSLLGVIISAFVLPCLGAWKTKYQDEIYPTTIATAKPLNSVMQDGLLSIVLIFFGGVMIIYLCGIRNNFAEKLKICVFIFVNLYWPLEFCLRNNVGYLHNQIELSYREDYRENIDKEALENERKYLCKHLQKQNILAFIALLVYSLIPFSIKIAHGLLNGKTFKKIITEYIPSMNDFEKYENK